MLINRKRRGGFGLAALVCCLFIVSAGWSQTAQTEKPAAKAAPGEQVEVKSTLENLNAAFQGESNAHARYQAFAQKADEEGYGPVASLFRAAAKSEEIHAKNHANAIKKMGGPAPTAKLDTPTVKSTRENLEAAIKGETYENTVMYPAFIKMARQDRQRDAVRSLNGAMQVEKGHAKLYSEALNNLEQWKGQSKVFYVCTVCGNTVTQLNFKKCPICFSPLDKFEKVS